MFRRAASSAVAAGTCKRIIAPKRSFVTSFAKQTAPINRFSQCVKPAAVQTFIVRHYAKSKVREIGLPALSPSMTMGNIVEWKVKEGDKISAGDVLCSVETDKAVMDFEYQGEDSYLAKIIAPAGTKEVPLNKTIALFVSKKDDIKEAAGYTIGGGSTAAAEAPAQPAAPQQTAAAPAPAAAAPKKSANIREVGLPALSPTMTTGVMGEWKVKEGDKITTGDVLCSVQTDKAAMDFEYQGEDAYIAKILAPAGTENVEVGKIILLLAKKKEHIGEAAGYVPGAAPSAPQAASAPAQTTASTTPSATTTSSAQTSTAGGRVFASPLAKMVASEKGIDLSNVQGSGPNSRIIKADVEDYLAKPAAKQAVQPTAAGATTAAPQAPVTGPAGAEFVDLPLSNVRKIIANRLLESKRNIPHYYLTVECQVDNLLKVRSQLNKFGETKGFKLSVNDFIVKAAALSMKKVPEVNSSWMGDFIRQYKTVDISVAVQTEGGLITPIVFNADRQGVADISNSVKSLAQKAREKKLAPHEFQGGTFTISNLGMFGISEFSAIINPPQSCILAVGAAEKKVVPNEGPDAKENPYKVVTTMKVTMSCDHRVVDGAVGAQWLQAFKENIENPLMLML